MMIPMLLLAGALTAQVVPPATPPSALTQVEAVELARNGKYREALEAFRLIVAANPADYDARVWIARLHGWLGDPVQAETVYRNILRERPDYVDAVVGLGGNLVTLGRPQEAVDLLVAAERRIPANPSVLAALARAYLRLARTSLAKPLIDRAVTLDPSSDNRLAREQILNTHAHRFEMNSWVEDFGAALPEGRSTDVIVNLRLHDRLRAFGRGQVQKKFGSREQRAGGGIEWRLRPQTMLAVSALAGRHSEVLPRADASIEVTNTLGRFDGALGYRYIEFATARVSVVSPGVTLWRGETLSLTGRYYLALTEFTSGPTMQRSHSALLRASYRPIQRLWVSGGYARGTENFETLSPDRIGKFRADTASAGVRLDLPSLTSMVGVYERQRRTTGADMSRITLSLVQRF
jgi:YaiO family outer membrane protein